MLRFVLSMLLIAGLVLAAVYCLSAEIAPVLGALDGGVR